IAGFGVLQYQRHARPASMALYKAPPPAAAPEESDKATNETASAVEPKSDALYSPASPGPTKERAKSEAPSATGALAGKAADHVAAITPGVVSAPEVNLPKSRGASGAVGGPLSGTHGPLMNQSQTNQLNQQNNQLNQTAQQNVALLQAPVNPPY